MPPAAVPSSPSETFAVPELPVLCKLGPSCKVHNPQAQNAFDHLVESIKTILGPSSGIDSKDVDVEVLMKAMREYTTDEKHWESFAFADPSRNYTRNFVDHGNGKANLLILVWTPGKSSLIHDHAGAHCIMKVKTYVYHYLLANSAEHAVDS
jgi:cysteine dioxygenase